MNNGNGPESVLECNVVPSNITYSPENIKQDNLFLFFNSSCYLKAYSLTEEPSISFTFAEPSYSAPVSNFSLILSSKSNSSESTLSFLLSV